MRGENKAAPAVFLVSAEINCSRQATLARVAEALNSLKMHFFQAATGYLVAFVQHRNCGVPTGIGVPPATARTSPFRVRFEGCAMTGFGPQRLPGYGSTDAAIRPVSPKTLFSCRRLCEPSGLQK